eukprot:m.196100 g.196100  ORF g.196100 m.196100 type:complete len:401 (+) comp18319_c0_seq2:1552-2754(+)
MLVKMRKGSPLRAVVSPSARLGAFSRVGEKRVLVRQQSKSEVVKCRVRANGPLDCRQRNLVSFGLVNIIWACSYTKSRRYRHAIHVHTWRSAAIQNANVVGTCGLAHARQPRLEHRHILESLAASKNLLTHVVLLDDFEPPLSVCREEMIPHCAPLRNAVVEGEFFSVRCVRRPLAVVSPDGLVANVAPPGLETFRKADIANHLWKIFPHPNAIVNVFTVPPGVEQHVLVRDALSTQPLVDSGESVCIRIAIGDGAVLASATCPDVGGRVHAVAKVVKIESSCRIAEIFDLRVDVGSAALLVVAGQHVVPKLCERSVNPATGDGCANRLGITWRSNQSRRCDESRFQHKPRRHKLKRRCKAIHNSSCNRDVTLQLPSCLLNPHQDCFVNGGTPKQPTCEP